MTLSVNANTYRLHGCSMWGWDPLLRRVFCAPARSCACAAFREVGFLQGPAPGLRGAGCREAGELGAGPPATPPLRMGGRLLSSA